jgi:hypothetical protein
VIFKLYGEFLKQFPENDEHGKSMELGREVTDSDIEIYQQNAQGEVGMWRDSRVAKQAEGFTLSPEDADLAREHYRPKPSYADMVRVRDTKVIEALEAAERIVTHPEVWNKRGVAWQTEDLVLIREALASLKSGRPR